jgi:hypothetical protein
MAIRQSERHRRMTTDRTDERSDTEHLNKDELIAELCEALGDTLRMLRAAHIQLGMRSADNKRFVKAEQAYAKARGAAR